jgi:hypothetical protein
VPYGNNRHLQVFLAVSSVVTEPMDQFPAAQRKHWHRPAGHLVHDGDASSKAWRFFNPLHVFVPSVVHTYLRLLLALTKPRKILIQSLIDKIEGKAHHAIRS